MADEFNASFTEGGIIHGGDIPTPSGETGADGKSAYEIAVENGFDGTVTEWLASLKGEKGDRGEQGIKGDKGDKGADGSQGVQGERGEKGEKGEKGADGKDGVNGKDGLNGENGKSAYELAVDNGFSGTLSEWLNSLKGVDGKDGAKGDKGDTGERGAQGIQGIQGEKGDKGDTGAQGLKGDSGVEQQIVVSDAVTSYSIKPNILYVFPELTQLDISFDLTDLNPNIVNDFHFQFTNGSTACELNLPENVNVGDLDVQADTVCEISIVNGLLSFKNWSNE